MPYLGFKLFIVHLLKTISKIIWGHTLQAIYNYSNIGGLIRLSCKLIEVYLTVSDVNLSF